MLYTCWGIRHRRLSIAVFALDRKDSVMDLITILDKDLQHQSRRGLPFIPIQKENARVTGHLFALVFLYLLHSQGFKGYCKTIRTISVIPREPGWYQENVLYFTLLTFYDVHFSRRCPYKSWSFFNWNFSRLQHRWSWRRAWYCYRKLNLVKISPRAFAFCPNVSLS